MKYVLLISYDGSDFSGWQVQPGKRTVQGELQNAAKVLFGRETSITASGRTDAGVHARGQVAQLDAETTIPPKKLAVCFNKLLPRDVRVLKSDIALENFDCTRNAKRKSYLYCAYFSATELPLLRRYAARLLQKPDVERMRQAARLLIGEHDFSAFRAAGFTSKTSVRTIYEIKIEERQENGYTLYQILVTGNGFLYHMVRILSGELFAIGCGKEEKITRAFQTGARGELSKTMPPEGLVLEKVEYEAPIFGAEE